MILLILSLCTFVFGTLLFRWFMLYLVVKGRYEKRLQNYVEWEQTVERRRGVRWESFLLPIKRLAKRIESVFNLSKNEQLLVQSGARLTLGELFIVRVMVVVLILFVGSYYHLHFLLLCMLGCIGYYLPIAYLKRRRNRRLLYVSQQLGEALGIIANAMRAGFSFMQALNMVAEELDEPLGPEFLKVIQEVNYGVSIEVAFLHMQERLPEKELQIVLNTLVVQRKTGGNLAYLLETMQNIIFDRARVKGEVRTLTAQGRLSSIIITVLPIVLAVYIQLVNPDYFQTLFSHTIGWAMVVYGLISIIVGWILIKKIVRIEV